MELLENIICTSWYDLNNEYTTIFGKSSLLQNNHKQNHPFYVQFDQCMDNLQHGHQTKREMNKFTSQKNSKFT